MAERSPYLEPANAGLAAAIALVLVCAGLAVVGPVRGRLAELRSGLAERSAELDEWRTRRDALRPVSDAERGAWALGWERVRAIPPELPEPELVARLAGAFQRPSVSGLEIERRRVAAEGRLELPIASPLSGDTVALTGEPVRVRFRARYEDALSVLGDLEAGRVAARIEAVELKRAFPHVSVDLTLLVFARREVAS